MRTSTQAGGVCAEEVKPAYVSIRQHTSAYVDAGRRGVRAEEVKPAYVSIRRHTSAYVDADRRGVCRGAEAR